MAKTVEEIEALALELPREERARLASSLLESLGEIASGKVREAWDRGIDERISAYGRGGCTTLLAADVIADARRRLG